MRNVTAEESREFIGAVKWRGIVMTHPLARLTVSPDGITVRPRPEWLRRIGAPSVDAMWRDIEMVQKVTRRLTGVSAVAFVVRGHSLTYRTIGHDLEEVLQAVGEQAPEKIAPEIRRWIVRPRAAGYA